MGKNFDDMTPDEHLKRATWHVQRSDSVGNHDEANRHYEAAATKGRSVGKDRTIVHQDGKFAFK